MEEYLTLARATVTVPAHALAQACPIMPCIHLVLLIKSYTMPLAATDAQIDREVLNIRIPL